MLRWVLWGGLALVIARAMMGDKAKAEGSEGPARVTWTDTGGAAKQRDFAKRSVAEEFASALRSAGAQAVGVSALA